MAGKKGWLFLGLGEFILGEMKEGLECLAQPAKQGKN
jgi:hypothetical protein